MASDHSNAIYDGTKPVYVDAKFRSDYGLRQEICIPPRPASDMRAALSQYLDIRSRRHLQIAEEVDAILLATFEESRNEPPITQGRPFPTGDNVAEILKEMEIDPSIRHYLMSPTNEDDEEAEEEVAKPMLKRARTDVPCAMRI